MGAVFIDLDRTLLRAGSGRVLSGALEAAGLPGAGRRFPGDDLWWSYYNRFGETAVTMLLARAAALAAKGWEIDRVAAAAAAAVPALIDLVAPGAPGALETWRAEGLRVVVVTTTPEHLIAPFAEALGADAVLATRYQHRDGVFTGTLEGGFAWGTGKLDKIRAFCETEGLELADCTAVSDSIFDLPMLRAVGRPVVVNPDPRLFVVAKLLRWPTAQWTLAGGVPKVAGVEPFGVVRHLLRPQLFPYARFEFSGVEHIPRQGPVVLASNHRSYFDVAALALLAATLDRPVRALAKKELFALPFVAPLLRAIGGIPVDRGRSGAPPFAEAVASLHRGEVVIVLPQGTIPRGEAFFDPVLVGHTGAARLVQQTGATVVPVGLWGTEHVWPRSSKLPDVTSVLHPRHVAVTVGRPVRLVAEDPRAATEELMAAIAALLPNEARTSWAPTADELARTYPTGVVPDHDG
jgi:putative phosphoserine phosphatase/1-acylglycerol-3-phosphate O-acyltransferase